MPYKESLPDMKKCAIDESVSLKGLRCKTASSEIHRKPQEKQGQSCVFFEVIIYHLLNHLSSQFFVYRSNH